MFSGYASQEAVNLWQTATADPESHPGWMQFYANALRDSLRKANSRRKGALAPLTTADWRALVYRELQADNWYAEPIIDEPGDEEVVSTEDRPFALSAKNNGASVQTKDGA